MVAERHDDEAVLWREYRECPDIARRNRLVEYYLPLAHRRADRAWNRWRSIPRDDLREEAAMAVIDAIRTFDPNRGAMFWTYAVWRIRGRIADALRIITQTRRKCPILCTPLVGDYSARRGRDPVEVSDECDAVLRCMTPPERYLASAVYMHDRTHEDVANECGVTETEIRRRLRCLRERAQRAMAMAN